MSMIWKSLGKPTLQKLIGQQHLDRLEKLLPGLKKGEFDPNEMYSLDGLTRIFDAFCGNQSLFDKNFRKQLFNTLSPEQVDAALKAVEEDPKKIDSFDKKIDRLSQAWKNRETAAAISKVLNIPDDALPEEKKDHSLIQDVPPAERPYKPLKDYQMPVFSEATEKLEPELARFIVQMPTGSGKTRTAVEIITQFIKSQIKKGEVVIWLAHSEELCEQAVASFMDIWPHVATKPLKVIRFWGDAKTLPYDFEENAFIVSSFQKLYNKVKSADTATQEIKRRAALIIVDEAHKVLADTYQQVTKAFMSNRTKVIGLTATPGRSVHDHDQNAALADFFFNKIVEIHTGNKKVSVLDYLRKKRVLSITEYEPLVTNLNYNLSAKDKSHLESFFDLPKDFLNRLGADDIRNAEIIKRLEQECLKNKRIIFFATSLEQSQFVSALLRFMDIKAAHVDGSTPKIQRQAAIDKFKKGELSVLCNYEVLSTGFDAPQTDVVFIARPTSSIVLYSQMIGRGLRGPAIGGTETCKIIDVVDNIQGFSNENKVYSYFEDYYK